MTGAFDTRAFRDACGGFATGVCVITTSTPDGQVVGITANSFASISLDPPLVMWSPAKSSRRHDVFAEAAHFAIHVLSSDQRAVADGFVREANAFTALDWHRSDNGTPLIDGCVTRFECDRYASHDAGDHTIILGQVTDFATAPNAPLVFAGGRYAGLGQP